MRSTKLLALLLSTLALAACKKEEVEGPLAGCQTASYASFCAADAQCCSFGCVYGVCTPNPLEGGVCRTSADCASPRFCVAGHCASVMCIDNPGACSSGPCCSGICSAGVCTGDSAPVPRPGPASLAGATVPYRVPIQLTNTSSDPDNVPSNSGLTYTWTVFAAPADAARTFSPSAAAAAPLFTPTLPGAYELRLRVASGMLSREATLTFTAENTVPEITMPADILDPAYQSRNVALTFAAAVRDRDGGPIRCSWAKKGPTAVAFTSASPWTVCAGASGMAAEGTSSFTLNEDEAGTWELQLGVDDGVNPIVSVSRFVNVQNDAPVLLPEPSTAKMATRYGNLGSTTLVPLHGSVLDVNGDAVTWTWSMTGVKPLGSTAARFVPAAGNQQDVLFEPDKEGLYTLNLQVDDGHGGTADKAVDVIVGPYVLPLGRVIDAAFVAGNLVLIGDDAGTGKLWIVNPAIPQIAHTITLASLPTALGVSQDGTQAVVGRAGQAWDLVNVTTGTLSGASRTGLGFDASSIAWANGRVYATSLGTSGMGTVRRLLPAATVAPYAVVPQQPSSFPPIAGVRAVGSAAHLWVLGGSGGAGALTRYVVDSNDQVRDPVQNLTTAVAGASGLWLSATGAELFFGGKTDVHDALDATVAPYLEKLGVLPAAPAHVGTMDSGGTLLGVISETTSTSLTRFTGVGASPAALVLPFIAENGERRDPTGRFAFIANVGGVTTYYAIVAVDRGTTPTADDLWGLFTLVP